MIYEFGALVRLDWMFGLAVLFVVNLGFGSSGHDTVLFVCLIYHLMAGE
jgi:hypothetical protein